MFQRIVIISLSHHSELAGASLAPENGRQHVGRDADHAACVADDNLTQGNCIAADALCA